MEPRNLLQEIATGSFNKVVQRNEKTVFIETRTEKVKNDVLREFVTQALEDGYDHKDLLEVLLSMDEAIEDNDVRQTLKQYLGES